MTEEKRNPNSLRERLWRIIFEAETPSGRFFDVALLWAICISVVAVMLESVDSINEKWSLELKVLEWFFTILFTIEYFLRIWLVRRPFNYVKSFYGIVDLLSCLPTYLAIFIGGSHHLMVVRLLRLLRVFRILKMVGHVRGANVIAKGLMASRAKITVFFLAVFIFAVIMGNVIYLVESSVEDSAFTNIPLSIYYTIVTITTVGFGDMVPVTVLGKALTSLVALSGYAIIAVPTGIVSAGMYRAIKQDETTDACPSCGVHGHLMDAKFCRKCGVRLREPELENESR